MSEPAAVAAVVAVTAATAVIGARGVRVSRTPADFLVAAREVPPMLNASAISGEYLSAASFLGVAGLAMQDGLGALWYAVGYAAGYLVLLATVAAPLRRFGAYTIPDFAEGRLDSPLLRRAATVLVVAICGFYLLPQLKGAGITLQLALGSPYWVGVAVLGVVVTGNVVSGGMKGITLVQAFQYWLKLTAIALPALVLLIGVHHASLASASRPAPLTFTTATRVDFPQAEAIDVAAPIRVRVEGRVDGVAHHGELSLGAGSHSVAAGASVEFPAGAAAPHLRGLTPLGGLQWSSPFVHLPGQGQHLLAATLGVLVATFLGAIGLPHILVRFYTNTDGAAARRTTLMVLALLSCFYLFPAIFALLGRLEAPGLYTSGQTDSVVLALPRLAAVGGLGSLLGAIVAAGAFAAFLSTSSGLMISVSGALAHDLLRGGVRTFRICAVTVGLATTLAGLAVAGFPINVLVGWAFAIAASSFCPLLVLGIWWSRLTWLGALVGLGLGGGLSSAAIVATMLGVGHSGWPAVLLGEPAIWAVPLAFTAMVAVSLGSRRRLPADVIGKLLALHLPEAVRLPYQPGVYPAAAPAALAPQQWPGRVGSFTFRFRRRPERHPRPPPTNR
ncbi:MAG TPA: cation acetate symporter [Mycobacteriales bacterium]|nr:cation acetate symporter [Mycobacteriales bacterium]